MFVRVLGWKVLVVVGLVSAATIAVLRLPKPPGQMIETGFVRERLIMTGIHWTRDRPVVSIYGSFL